MNQLVILCGNSNWINDKTIQEKNLYIDLKF